MFFLKVNTQDLTFFFFWEKDFTSYSVQKEMVICIFSSALVYFYNYWVGFVFSISVYNYLNK